MLFRRMCQRRPLVTTLLNGFLSRKRILPLVRWNYVLRYIKYFNNNVHNS